MQNYQLKLLIFIMFIEYNTYPDVNRFIAFTKKDYMYYIDDIYKFKIIKNLDSNNMKELIDKAYIFNYTKFEEICLDFLEYITSIKDEQTESRMLILTNEIVRGKSNFEVVRINGENVIMNSYQLHPENNEDNTQNDYEQIEEQEELKEELEEEMNNQNNLSNSIDYVINSIDDTINNYLEDLENETLLSQDILDLDDYNQESLESEQENEEDFESQEESEEDFESQEKVKKILKVKKKKKILKVKKKMKKILKVKKKKVNKKMKKKMKKIIIY